MRLSSGIVLIGYGITYMITILVFRHLLEQNDLGEQICEAVKTLLKSNNLVMKQCSIDGTSNIPVLSFIKNEKRVWDSEIHQTKR